MSTASASRFSFPVSLDVAGRRYVVAGGGPLAQDKADALRAAGADVVEVAAGDFTPELLDDTFLLIVSGEDDTDTAATFAEAEQRGVLTNTLDDIPSLPLRLPRAGEARAAQARHLDRRQGPRPGTTGPTRPRGPATQAARRAGRGLRRRPPGRTPPAGAPRGLGTRMAAAVADIEGLLALCEDGHHEQARDRILATVLDALRHSNGAEHGPIDLATEAS